MDVKKIALRKWKDGLIEKNQLKKICNEPGLILWWRHEDFIQAFEPFGDVTSPN